MEKQYLKSVKKRLDEKNCTPYIYNSLAWYIKAATLYKILYYVLNIIAIIVPVFSAIITIIVNEVWLSVCSSIGSVAVSLLGLFECQKRWKLYRESAEKLRGIIELSLVKEAFKQEELVIECEKLCAEENIKWGRLMVDKDGQ